MTPRNIARFVSYCRPTTVNGCWMWAGPVSSSGYGKFTIRKTAHGAHRVAWLLFRGRIPRERQVLHECDNPLCVNPEHLWLGTHTDNMRDMHAKGRWSITPRRGSDSPTAKLTERDIHPIRFDPRPQHVIAAEYGVQQMCISRIKTRQTWRHI